MVEEKENDDSINFTSFHSISTAQPVKNTTTQKPKSSILKNIDKILERTQSETEAFTLQKELKKSNNEISTLKNKLVHQDIKIQQLEKIISAQRLEIEILKARVDTPRTNLVDKDEIETAKREINNLADNFHYQIKNYELDYADLKSEIKALSSKNKLLEKALNEFVNK